MLTIRPSRPLAVALALAALGLGGAVIAQSGGVTPIDSSGNYEVSGVKVDVSAKDAESARYGGWKLAQRKAWQVLSKRLGGSGALVSDSTLDSLVSGIVIGNEQIGPDRYIATLAVQFDRARAGSLLGVAMNQLRSPPLLVIPIEFVGGTATSVERRTGWQEAWAKFRTGDSSIDYVRPTGTGPDPLLLNAGQAGRRDRGWWRIVLDQYGASDVVIPTVRLYRDYPGGPAIGVFEARYGPDDRLLQRFTLRVNNGSGVPQLLDAGIARIDQAYQDALRSGVLRVDPSLAYIPPPAAETPEDELAEEPIDIVDSAAQTQGTTISVQFDTPGAGAVSATEAALRGVPGVRSAITTSLALGGTSVMRVVYGGDIAGLRAALEARGWQVDAGAATLRIRRVVSPPSQPAPDVPGDSAAGG